MISDLRYAWRAIWKSPTTSLGAMLALALGVGATTTIFGLLNAVLLRPLPFPESDRLVEIWGTVQREQAAERRGTSWPDYFDWRDKSRSFDAMSVWLPNAPILYDAGEPEQINSEVVEGPYFELLGARAIAGRLFEGADHQRGAAPVAVISESLWEQRFNRGGDVLGKPLRLNANVFTIIGVAPAAFRGRSDAAVVWTPMASTIPPAALTQRGNRGFAPMARIKSGVSLAAAQAEIVTISAQLEQQYPETNEKRSAQVVLLADQLFQTIRPAVSLLFGVVTLVLMIACANVASLLLARGEARRREMSLRRALGADDRQLVRLLLAESAMLVVMGGGLGWVLSQWTSTALVTFSPVQLPSFAVPETDWRTLGFAAIVGVLTTVLIGLTPMGSLGGSLAQSLREGSIEGRGGGRVSTLRFMVVGEVAVAVALLVGAALLGRSFAALLEFDPGFKADGVLAMRVQLPPLPAPATPPVAAAAAAAQAPAGTIAPAPAPVPAGPTAFALLDQLRAIPGVQHASLTSVVPLAGGGAIFYAAEGMPPVDATNRPRAFAHRISQGHFATLGMTFIEGRDFTASELTPQSTALIVSENVVKRFWPGQSGVGRRVKQGDLRGPTPWLTIVGVVREANLRGIPRNPTADPDLYFPFNGAARGFAVLLRTTGDPTALTAPARQMVQQFDRTAAIFQVQSLQSLVDTQTAAARFLSWLTGAFAVVALTLALIGIYGMLSYWVRRRTAEIGIRTALGANRARVLRLVVGQALTMAVIGVVVGVVLAAALTRFVETQLFGVQALDWQSFAGTAALMLAAAIVASVAPALRALRLDPIAALRSGAA